MRRAKKDTPANPHVESWASQQAGTPPEAGHPGGSGRQASHEEIARLAHSYWEARGRQGGSPDDDWFRAEREWKTRSAGREKTLAAGS